MKHIIFVFAILIFSFNILLAIDYVEKSRPIEIESPRQSLIKYYDDSVDQFWAGANFWAVRYDFTDGTYAEIDSFEIHDAYIYLADLENQDVTIYLRKDINGQPDSEILETIDFQCQPGFNHIQFSQTHVSEIFWLELELETTNEIRLPASAVNGENSYYGIAEESQIFYYNFLAEGYQSELIFAINGTAFLANSDIELTNCTISNNQANEFLRCHVEITNNSPGIANCELEITLQDTATTVITQEISGLVEDVTYADIFTSDSLFISELPKEYQLTVRIVSDEDGTSYNNQKTFKFNTFSENNPKKLIENFVLFADTSSDSIWTYQQEIVSEDTLMVINYFSDISDIFYSGYSSDRFSYYDLFGYPSSIIDGTERLVGFYDESYADSLENSLSGFNSFVVEEVQNRSLSLNPVAESIYGGIYLINPQSYILASTADNLELFAGITEISDDYERIFGKIMKQQISISEDILLNYGESTYFEILMDFSDINFEHNIFDEAERHLFNLCFWLQNSETKEIYYADEINLTNAIVDNENNTTEPSKLSIFPNPTKDRIFIESKSKNSLPKKVKIFNIKGQFIAEEKIDSSQKSFAISLKKYSLASGIYFLKFDDQKNNFLQKVLLIK